MFDYEEVTIEALQEVYTDTGWPHVCDGDLNAAYCDCPEDV